MIKFVKNNSKKIIITIVTLVMIVSAIPFTSLAEENSNLSTTTTITASVSGRVKNNSTISFTVHDPLKVKYIYYVWDLTLKNLFKIVKEVEK